MNKNKKLIIAGLCLVLIAFASFTVYGLKDEDGSSVLANLIAGVKVKRIKNLTEADIKDLISVVEKISKDTDKNGIDFVSSNFSKNTHDQLANYLKIHKMSLSDPDVPDSMNKSRLQLKRAQVMPLAAIDKKSIIKAIQDGSLRKITEKFTNKTGTQSFTFYRCTSFVNENGWKVQSSITDNTATGMSDADTLADVTKNCYQKYPDAPDISKSTFYNVNMSWSSEYQYFIYLNNSLIETGGLGGGIGSIKLPLNKGKNKLMVVLGTSQKSLIKDTDPMYEMIKGINGLSVKITEGKKTLVDMQADKGSQSVEKEFTY